MKFQIGFLILLCIFTVSFSAQITRADSIERVGACATPGLCWNVFVRDSIAYVADYGRVTTVNCFDPSNPWVADSLNSGPPVGALGIYVQDTVAYCNLTALGSVFITVNVARSDSLYLMGQCYVPPAGGPDPTGIYAIDTIVYLANGDDGLGLINVANPLLPDTINYYNTPGWTIDIAIKDTLIYIADRDSLLILNISNPLNPFRVGSVNMPTSCYGVFVDSNYAYVTCLSNFGIDGMLKVVNIIDPTSPEVLSDVNNIRGDPIDVYVSGDYAYVVAADYWFLNGRQIKVASPNRQGKKADIEGGLRVINISNPDSVYLVISFDTPGDPRGVFAVDTLVFVADYDSLQILKYSDNSIEETNSKLHNKNYQLEQNYPNPFSSFTNIRYSIPMSAYVSLKIFDLTGRIVKTLTNEVKSAGFHSVQWDRKDSFGHTVANGVYFYQLYSGSHTLTRRMLLIK